ncbi:MAG: hypothetical protein U0694_28640 [Anaerolineae bacterium]
MEQQTLDSLTIEVDAEHVGIRSALFGAFVGGGVLGYLIAATLFSSGNFSLLAVIGAMIGSFVVSNITERLLVGRWKSGRVVKVDTQGVRTMQKERVQKSIDGGALANVLRWRFEVQKRARVPQGWFMIACALEQDDNFLVAYTFVSPKQFEDMEDAALYPLLLSKKDKKAEQDLRLAGVQRRLQTAETYRWAEGAEMNDKDFAAFMTRIQSQFPTWIF